MGYTASGFNFDEFPPGDLHEKEAVEVENSDESQQLLGKSGEPVSRWPVACASRSNWLLASSAGRAVASLTI